MEPVLVHSIFSAKKYQGMKGRKAVCEFAKQCEIEWDGLTNVKGTY